MTPPLFAFLALEWFALAVLLGCFAVYLVTRPADGAPGAFSRWEMGMFQLLLVALAALAGAAGTDRLSRGQRAAAMLLSATAVIYGIGAVGIKAIEWAAWGEPHMIVVPAAQPADTVTPSLPQAAPVTGDPVLGAKSYAATCAACHGVNGVGIPQVAPALRHTEFMSASPDAAVQAVIVIGRMADDPASATGRAMPARGGNPFLTDADVANIIAYLREDSGETIPSTAADAAAPVLPAWVVPPAAPPVSGPGPALIPPPPSPLLPPEIATLQYTPPQRTFAVWGLALSGLHAAHLLAAIAAAMLLMWTTANAREPTLALAKFNRFYWFAALMMWVLLFPLLYLL